jgi:GT2 family glycosyltransferase
MKVQPKVAIVILNWNGWEDTLGCLESLFNADYSNYCIIVVDNGSTDNSIARIREYAKGRSQSLEDKQIKIRKYEGTEEKADEERDDKIEHAYSDEKLVLIENGKNRGFAGGNNAGIEYALEALDPKYVLLLNNDTLVDRSFLAELVKVIETDEAIGGVQSLLLRPGGELVDSLGQEILWSTVRDIGFGSKYVDNSLAGKVEIFGPCAAAALYRAGSLQEVGLFDESFFIMGEDVDLSWRLRLKGYSSFLVPSSVVYHKRGVSGGMRPGTVLINRYYGNRNWLLIVLRYYPLSVVYLVPRRLLSVFTRCISNAARLGKVHEVFQLFYRSLKLRRIITKNPTLKELQLQWITDK